MTLTDFEKKSKATHDRLNPFPAKLIECRRLSKAGSSKENLHVVVDLSGSGIKYEVGSSFGIYPENHPAEVAEILELLELDPDFKIIDKRSQSEMRAECFFTKKVNLSQITSSLFKLILEHELNETLQGFLENKEKCRAFIAENDLISFLRTFWNRSIPVQKLCDLLSTLLPRYYSIASSMSVVGSHAHFMVASFSYMQAGKMKQSVTSDFFKSLSRPMESTVSLFLHENPNFSLPKNDATPIIMIGPGTGFAVFRGFLQEREKTNASGKNWLFTGDRERKYDFHYEEELTELENKGLLKLSTAFSRDGSEKIYVQNLMMKESQEFWNWILEGATIYICGDAKNMAKDVQETLLQIACKEGDLSPDQAKSFIKNLKQEKRLLLDVY